MILLDFIESKRGFLQDVSLYLLATIGAFLAIFITKNYLAFGHDDMLSFFFSKEVSSIFEIGKLNFYSMAGWALTTALIVFSITINFGQKAINARAFSSVVSSIIMWSLGIGFVYAASTEREMLFWLRLNYFAGGLIGVAFLYYTLLVVDWRPAKKWYFPILTGTQIYAAYVYLFTDLAIKSAHIAGADPLMRSWEFGEWKFFPLINFSIFYILGIINLNNILIHDRLGLGMKEGMSRRKVFITLLALSLPAIIASILLPRLGIFKYYWTGPIPTILWAVFSFYALAKYKFLPVKIIITEIAILSLSAILFMNIFIPEEDIFAIPPSRIIIFLAFSVIGLYFIKNMMEGEDNERKLFKIRSELTDFNKELEERAGKSTTQLTYSNQHLSDIIENLTDGVIEYDESFTILRLNKQAEAITGLLQSEIIGKIIEPRDASDARLSILAMISFPVMATSSTQTIITQGANNEVLHANEITIKNNSDSFYQVFTVLLPAKNKKGSSSGFLKIVRDITREKVIQKSKSDFVSISAHQIRTPLTTQNWIFDSLISGDYGQLNEKQKEAAERGKSANKRAIVIANNLLIVSRIEENRFEYSFKKGDLTLLIKNILDSYQEQVRDKKINLSMEMSHDTLPIFDFDSEKMEIAIRNIIDNSIVYSPNGGDIKLILEKDDDNAKITVKDNGIGIPEKQLQLVPAKFFRANNAVLVFTDGSGLGLYITKKITEKHGGKLNISSQINIGTTVITTLPFNAPAIIAN